MRRIPSLDNLIPVLFLKGISTGDFTEALETILGENAKGLSASTVVRLKKQWEQDYRAWAKRDITGTRYVYFWADGIHFNVRLEDTEKKRQCILVIIGARVDGTKELVAVNDGYRESKLSWMELLSSLKERGLIQGPKRAIGDGALGFWAALRETFPDCEEQRCLRSQGGKHPRQNAEERATEGKREDPRHLPGSHRGAGSRCLQQLSYPLQQEVPRGLRVPVKGQGRPFHLL